MNYLFESLSSISHLEHLPVNDFIEVVTNLDQYIVSEKVDGAALNVGIDEHGVYTSYGKQADDRKYNTSDYEFKFATTYRRSSHAALVKVEDILRKHMSEGDEIALEILFGKYPNVVPYTNNSNTVVFLQNVRGNTDIGKLTTDLRDQSVSVKLVVPITVDGVTTQRVSNRYAFSFSSVPTARIEGELLQYLNNAVQPHIKNIKKYLAQPSGVLDYTVKEIINFNLRKRPDNISKSMWSSIKEQIKEKRDQFNSELKGYYLPIKDIFLNTIVSSNSSKFGSEGDWIEGVVLRHPYRNQLVKIVDRDLFLGAKEFLWKVRERIIELPFSVDQADSHRSKLYIDIGSTFGFPSLGTKQATASLKRKGDSVESILNSFDVTQNIGNRIKKITTTHRKKLMRFLNEYMSKYSNMTKNIKNREFTYDGEIHNRTLQSFADLFSEINRIERTVLTHDNPYDIIEEILEPQFNRIFT